MNNGCSSAPFVEAQTWVRTLLHIVVPPGEPLEGDGMKATTLALALLTACGVAGGASAQLPFGEESGHGKKAQGAIVLRDDAPVYKEKGTAEVWKTLKRGASVAGLHREAIVFVYEFVEEAGRVRVIFPNPDSSKPFSGWMDPADLSMFTYDCGCESNCMPWAAGFGPSRWNLCFKEARDAKMERLQVLWAEQRSRH
jgi:hypothetical protein